MIPIIGKKGENMIIIFMICPLEQINNKLREEATRYANEHLKHDGIIIDLAGYKNEHDITKLFERGFKLMKRSDVILCYGKWKSDKLCSMLRNVALEADMPLILGGE